MLIKKEEKAKKLIKEEIYTLEEIAELTGLEIKRVKKIAFKTWNIKIEIDDKIENRGRFKAKINELMRKKYGFYRL